MEQTLGKRIMAHRKRLGLTQDQLAEKLGVTAQAVSKWENDQSCPDITMLPKLAEIFSITTDELLGVEPAQPVHQGEVIDRESENDDAEPDGIRMNHGNFEIKLNGAKRSSIGFSVLVLAVGGLVLAKELLHWDVTFWNILWPTALLVFGLFGVLPRFSFFHMGCLLFGGYFLLDNLQVLPFDFGWNLVLPAFLLIFGLSLLVDALRKPGKKFHYRKNRKHTADYNVDDESFNVSVSFGEENREITMPRLSYGNVNVSFGECKIDLSGVEELAKNCVIDANCSFGELEILVPSRYLIQCERSSAFAEVSVHGKPDPEPQGTVCINANASFGEIDIRYI